MPAVDMPAFSHRASNQCLTCECEWKAKDHQTCEESPKEREGEKKPQKEGN